MYHSIENLRQHTLLIAKVKKLLEKVVILLFTMCQLKHRFKIYMLEVLNYRL